MIVKISPANVYTFKYEKGLSSTNIGFIDTDNSTANSYAQVQSTVGGRDSVLMLRDTALPGEHVDIEHTGFSINPTGCIEFIFGYTTNEPIDLQDLEIYLYDGATQLIQFIWDFDDDDLDYNNGGGVTQIYNGSDSGVFYILSIRIDIDAGVNGQFDCYLYDSEYTELANVTGIEFQNNATKVDKIRFYTDDGTNPASQVYIDSVGISTEGGYTLGDIQYGDTDFSAYMNDCRIHYGVFPFKSKFTFTAHPTHYTYFNIGDFIDIFDDTPTLRFAGWIKIKPQKVGDKFECEGMANEVFERSYDKTFTTDTTKEKLQDITTTALKFCTEGTYDATATDWSYEFNRACVYMFNLTRWMERQVPYIKPDGEIMVKDYDGLTKELQYYGGTYNFRDELGETGTNIDFVDSATLYDGACEIVSSWQSHRNVLRLLDDATVGEDPYIIHNETQATSGTREFWIGTNNVTVTEGWYFHLYEHGHDYIVYLRIYDSALDYRDSGDVWQEIQAVANDTFYHIKIVWRADNTFDVYVDGTLKVDNVATNNNMVSGINRFYIRCYGDSEDYIYLDAYGDPDNDPAYSVGDNNAAWSLSSSYQHVQLVDIPMLNERIPGYYKGNTGITSVSVRYINNTVVVRPATPTETFINKRLKEFRDPKIQELATAQQIGDNLFAIFALETIFLGLRGEGLGWLQPGETLEIESTRQITITKADFLLLSVIYDPKNDIHHQMIVSNNIITPREFKSEFDTSGQQIHTAVLQSSENQGNIGGSSNTYMEYDDDDPAGWDIEEGDLTIDGAWNECDLDGFKTVPSDAIGFWAKVKIMDAAGGSVYARFRATSQANAFQSVIVSINGRTDEVYDTIPIPLDSNHKFDYNIDAVIEDVGIIVLWWIRQPGG